jgi:Ca2+-binding EF-hand superfamily protein
MNNKKELTIEDLNELLIDNEINNFDPVYEAFKVFDPNNEGHIDGEKLKQSFLAFGFGELSEEGFDILIRAAHVDGDGSIHLEDFRNMLETTSSKPKK